MLSRQPRYLSRQSRFLSRKAKLLQPVVISRISMNYIWQIIVSNPEKCGVMIVSLFCAIFIALAFFLPSSAIKNNTGRHPSTQLSANEGRIQIFYYPWYGNPAHDQQWIHWNHKILPHWKSEINAKYKIGSEYNANEEEIGSIFYPKLGLYSSSDTSIIEQHFKMLTNIANIHVLIVSWHSPLSSLSNIAKRDAKTSENMDIMFNCALKLYSESNEKKKTRNNNNLIQIAVHLEPYDGRTATSTFKDIQYLNDRYSQSPVWYRSSEHENKPFYYMYDSYKMKDQEWNDCLSKIRGTSMDGIFLGLYIDKSSERHILNAGFDGFYTYFVAKDFTFGSSIQNWNRMNEFAIEHSLVFVPSVGPGYDDTRVRPWNKANTFPRKNGLYFSQFFKKILDINSNSDEVYQQIRYISITSFNEWHEGTQIEPAISKQSESSFQYQDYENEGGSDYYLKLTQKLGNKYLDTLLR